MSDMDNAIEIDVTPKWWRPLDEKTSRTGFMAMFELFMRWRGEPTRFGAALIRHENAGAAFHIGDSRIVAKATTDSTDLRQFCDAVFDRLSSPDVARMVLGRVALMAGDGERTERHSDTFGQIFVTTRPETTDALVEWVDRGENFRMLLTSRAMRRLFGLEDAK